MNTLQTRDPQHLKNKFHPALKQIPELPEGSDEFLALAGGLKKVGFIRPILIDSEDRIIDDHSRSLLRAALRWQLKEVPVQIHSAENAPLVRLHSLAHVRHLSKSAIAYLAVPDLDAAIEVSRARRLENLRKSPNSSIVRSADDRETKVEDLVTAEDLASELGIGRTMLFEARKVRKEFEDKKAYTFNIKGGSEDGALKECTLKAWYEPKLLQAFVGGEHENNRPLGLGGILAGIASVREGNRDKFNPKNQGQLSLFENKVDVLGGFKYWPKLSEKERNQHFHNIEEQIARLADDQRDAMADYFETLAKKCREVKGA